MHSVLQGEHAVVSTATLALQRQILGQDLPRITNAVKAHLPRAPEVALLKGWHNYLCLHKISGGYPEEVDSSLLAGPELSPSIAALLTRHEYASLGHQELRLR